MWYIAVSGGRNTYCSVTIHFTHVCTKGAKTCLWFTLYIKCWQKSFSLLFELSHVCLYGCCCWFKTLLCLTVSSTSFFFHENQLKVWHAAYTRMRPICGGILYVCIILLMQLQASYGTHRFICYSSVLYGRERPHSSGKNSELCMYVCM